MWLWGNNSWGWGMSFIMIFFMLAFLGIIVWAIVMFTNHSTSQSFNQGDVEHSLADPKRILDERFARGEIEEDEYQKRKAVLQQNK